VDKEKDGPEEIGQEHARAALQQLISDEKSVSPSSKGVWGQKFHSICREYLRIYSASHNFTSVKWFSTMGCIDDSVYQSILGRHHQTSSTLLHINRVPF